MGKKGLFIKALAILGTILAWLPIFAPILISVTVFFIDHRFLFDYLMPAELFPVALLGGGLLIYAASLKCLHRRLIAGSFAIALGSLISGQAIAVITGLASGKIAPSGWPWLLVILSLIIYILALIGIGIGGLLLLRNLSPSSPNLQS